MKVICAPDKFKGSLTAIEAAAAMKRGILHAVPDATIDLCPIADGGEGFLATLHAARGGTLHSCPVTGPRGQHVSAQWLALPSSDNEPACAAIEMAQASGLQLLTPAQRDPTRTSTQGTGELMVHALRHGHTHLYLGIGGSATNDGGIGMAMALGTRFFTKQGEELSASYCEHFNVIDVLRRVHRIDLAHTQKQLESVAITVACDVTNPLTGLSGASHIYGPQKGASRAQIDQLDAALAHLAERVKTELGLDIASHPGSGAAGGLGFGLMAFTGAELKPGIDLILDAVQFHQRVASCDLCLTGEGRLDEQSLAGKACIGIARAASIHNVPTIALVGASLVTPEQAQQAGLSSYHVISSGRSSEESMRDAAGLLEEATSRAMAAHMKRKSPR